MFLLLPYCCLQVQQVAWHPNGLVLATACTDFKCRVVSAIVEEVRHAFFPCEIESYCCLVDAPR